jgi:hypothetical protein
VNALRKVGLLSLGLIAMSLGPVRAEPGSQTERPFLMAQRMGMPGTSCYRNGMQVCLASYRMVCLCMPGSLSRCAWSHTGQRC